MDRTAVKRPAKPATPEEALKLEMSSSLYRIITRARRAGWKLRAGATHVLKGSTVNRYRRHRTPPATAHRGP